MMVTKRYKNPMEIFPTHAEVILCDNQDNEKARAIIDLGDIEVVGRYRWHESKGYVCNSNNVRLHRFLLDAPIGMCVDHINGNPMDNRKSNLRPCTQAENNRNTQLSKKNTTGYKGVTFEQGRYRARIYSNGRKVSLGYYDTPEEAAVAYDKAAIKVYGEFAKPNFDRSYYITMNGGKILTYDELIEMLTEEDESLDEVLELATEPDDL